MLFTVANMSIMELQHRSALAELGVVKASKLQTPIEMGWGKVANQYSVISVIVYRSVFRFLKTGGKLRSRTPHPHWTRSPPPPSATRSLQTPVDFGSCFPALELSRKVIDTETHYLYPRGGGAYTWKHSATLD